MKIEFELHGTGLPLDPVDSAGVPQKGDIVHYKYVKYTVTGVTYLIEKSIARILVHVERLANQ